ncbi:YhaI family protein [Halobacillus shinanisalinarum]|uniref:YhaI family protein n=1 Tax=Halobacillus shinanisalinarum TaxID=2932258 RepID=A0ABY4GZE9_9BACI|nr:DUF1878 family protein [Halobacillus shinanisalinarum]UOQ92762.1 YhaI family protein [Halobacillus shinanisalinarum]
MERADPDTRLHFHLQLLLQVKEMKQYPFTKMVIHYGLTEEEYRQTLRLFEELEDTYEQDLENGLIDHSLLLIHFAGMLSYKMPVERTIIAMYEENIYPLLTNKLLQLLKI